MQALFTTRLRQLYLHAHLFDNIYLAKTGYLFPLRPLVLRLICLVLALESLQGFFYLDRVLEQNIWESWEWERFVERPGIQLLQVFGHPKGKHLNGKGKVESVFWPLGLDMWGPVDTS